MVWNSKNIFQIFFRLLIILQVIILLNDFHHFRFIEGQINSNTFTESSTFLVYFFLITLIIARILFPLNNNIILSLFIIASLEAFGNYVLKGVLHTGYLTHLIGLIVLFIFSFDNQTRFSAVIDKYINIKSITVIAVIMYGIGLYIFNAHTMIDAKSALGDSVNTWMLTGWDQSAYYRMVLQILDGSWFFGGVGQAYGNGYYYPIGYPLLGALGHFFYSKNPFLLINILTYVLSIIVVYVSVKRFTHKSMALIALILVGLQSPFLSIEDLFLRAMIMPFNNIVTYFASALFLLFLFLDRKIKTLEYFYLGLSVAFVLLARYTDALIFVIPLFYLAIIKNKCSRIKSLSLSFLPLLIALVIALYLNKIFYGDYFITYHNYAGKHDFWFHPFAFSVDVWKFLEIFLFPPLSVNEYNYSSYLLPMVYVVFFPLGIYALIKKNRMFDVIFALILISTNILYFLSADAVTALSIRYDAFRYFGPSVIFIAFFSFVGLYTFYNQNNQKFKVYQAILVIMITVIFIYINPIKEYLHNLSRFDIEIEYLGKEDLVLNKPYPNYGKDGIKDYKLKVRIDSLVPIYLTSVEIISPNGEVFLSESIYQKKTMLGIGIINSYGNNVKLAWGDNCYKNFYLDDKMDLILVIPGYNYEQNGNYEIILGATTGIVKKSFLLSQENLKIGSLE